MAGTFVGVAGVQQFQLIGADPRYGSKPMAGGKLYVYAADTTIPASTFQDIDLTVPAQNPLELDPTGRIPQFYVDDGFYKLILTDADGVTSNGGFVYPSVPSIGAATSGGGGGGVDPTTLLQTGFVIWIPIQGTLTGFIRCNGRTIGSASSGASERANADCQLLFLWVWANLSQPSANVICPVVGGLGASAAADWAANKQITLLDMRGRAEIGLDDMGSTAAGRLSATSTATPTTPATTLGTDAVTLAIAQMPVHDHGALTGVDSPDHTHTGSRTTASPNAAYGSGGTNAVPSVSVTTPQTGGASVQHKHAITAQGGGAAHVNMPPGMLGSFFQKL